MTGAAAGAVEPAAVLGSACHTLRADLTDVVEWRIRAMTLTIEPIVASTAAGTISGVLCPSQWGPRDQATIINNGGTRKKVTQKLVLTMQGSDDQWINHANSKAWIYLCDDTATSITCMAKVSYTIQVRGKR